MIKTLLRGAFSAILCLQFCAALPVSAAPATASDENIPVILSATGPAAFLGREMTLAFGAIQTFVNTSGGIAGHPVKFIIQDDQSNPQLAVQLVNGAISQRAAVIMGPVFTQTCRAVLPLVVTSGPVQYCLSPGVTPPAGSYAYSATAAVFDVNKTMVRYFRDRGVKRIALLTSTDATGQAADQSFDRVKAEPENTDVALVYRGHFNLTDLSMAALIENVRASGAQAVFVLSTGTAFGNVLHAVHDAGLTIPIATSQGNISYEQMNSYASIAGKNIYFPGVQVISGAQSTPGPTRDAQLQLVRAYERAGLRVDYVTQAVWDPAMLIVDALRHLGAGATAPELNTYIQGLHDWYGTYGRYDFRRNDQRGIDPADAVVIERWDPGTGRFLAVSAPGGRPLNEREIK